jgi:hypothetical protein
MAKLSERGIVGVLALAVVMTAPALLQAQTPIQPKSQSPAAQPIPDRERELIALLMDTRKQYQSAGSASTAKNVRMTMQINVLRFMRQSQAAQDWIGTVKSRGTTPEGEAWIVLEIADGITVGTWQTKESDFNASTLFQPHSALFKASQALRIGQLVTFSGTFLRSVLASDEQMVTSPQFIARFSALAPGS